MNRRFRIVTISAAILWAVFCALVCSDAGIGMLQFLVFAFGGIAVVGLWLIRLFVYAVWSRRRGPINARSWLVEPLLVALVAVAVLTGAAFRLRFAVSWPFLARYAQGVQTGRVEAGGRHESRVVGLFLVRETEALPGGVVRMITSDCGFDDCGIAYGGSVKPPRIGEDSYTALGGGWWQWWRSW
jgi:hypothetical protein